MLGYLSVIGHGREQRKCARLTVGEGFAELPGEEESVGEPSQNAEGNFVFHFVPESCSCYRVCS